MIFPAGAKDVCPKGIFMEEKRMQSPLVVWGGALFCCALWGSAFPAVKIGYRLFGIEGAPAVCLILFAGCRFLLAGLQAVGARSAVRGKLLLPRRGNWHLVAGLACVQTVLQYLFFYIGLANTTGVRSSILNGMGVFFSLLVASCVFRTEKLGANKLAGCALGFAGVLVINLTGGDLGGGFSLTGEGFILLSSLCSAFAASMVGRFSKREDPVVLSGWQFILGGSAMILFGLAAGGRLGQVTGAGLVMLFYLAFISSTAFSIWGVLLKYNPVSRVTVFGFTRPVFGVILSGIFLGEAGEAFNLRNLAALALVSVGILLVNRKKQ